MAATAAQRRVSSTDRTCAATLCSLSRQRRRHTAAGTAVRTAASCYSEGRLAGDTRDSPKRAHAWPRFCTLPCMMCACLGHFWARNGSGRGAMAPSEYIQRRKGPSGSSHWQLSRLNVYPVHQHLNMELQAAAAALARGGRTHYSACPSDSEPLDVQSNRRYGRCADHIESTRSRRYADRVAAHAGRRRSAQRKC